MPTRHVKLTNKRKEKVPVEGTHEENMNKAGEDKHFRERGIFRTGYEQNRWTHETKT